MHESCGVVVLSTVLVGAVAACDAQPSFTPTPTPATSWASSESALSSAEQAQVARWSGFAALRPTPTTFRSNDERTFSTVTPNAGSDDARAHVLLPKSSVDDVRIDDARQTSVAFHLRDEHAVQAKVANGVAYYFDAGPEESSVLVRAEGDGVEDFVVFDRPPSLAALVYDVDVSRVAGLRWIGDELELLDATGTPRLRMMSPSLVDAGGKTHRASIDVSGCATDRSPAAPWNRSVTSPHSRVCTLAIRWDPASLTYPVLVDPSWTLTGMSSQNHFGHTATLLNMGKVLIAGGFGVRNELYDPTTGTFANTGSFVGVRASHTATLLASGKVLVAGGSVAHGGTFPSQSTDSAEVYDPATGTFTDTASMNVSRSSASSARLADGRVLVAGGTTTDTSGSTPTNNPTWTAELYEPATGTFTTTGSMQPNGGVSLLALPSGLVLATGCAAPLSAQLYNPATGSFTFTGAATGSGCGDPAVLMTSGRVLIVGRSGAAGGSEIYEPATDSWHSTMGNLPFTVAMSRGVGLSDGSALLTGGSTPTDTLASTASFLFDATTETFAATTPLHLPRVMHTATLLQPDAAHLSDRVLVVGGTSPVDPQYNVAELWQRVDAGDVCATGGECVSGQCAGGRCCTAVCADACDPTGACKLAVGASCDGGVSTCASGYCAGELCADQPDAGPDGGVDGGTIVDAGSDAETVADAGITADASTLTDGGVPRDAGLQTDSGALVDSGSAHDSGLLDSGNDGREKGSVAGGGGCSCNFIAGDHGDFAAAAGQILLGLAVFRRRRRRV